MINLIVFDYGLQHQSNGQIQELSRSWDRIYIRNYFLRDNFLAKLTLWYRLPEERKIDDNPDIEKFLGYGEVDLAYKISNSNLGLRLMPSEKLISAELTFSKRIKDGVQAYVTAFHGYGNSLIEFNTKSDRFGIGFILEDPFTRADAL